MLTFRQRWEFPLLARELTESAGRPRTYMIRGGYAAFIAIAGTITWLVMSPQSAKVAILNLDVGPAVGYWIYYFQTLALQWLWPIIACTALTVEKERNTLSTLLLTRLTPTVIVLEKFLSRLLLATTLLLTCLPLFAYCFYQSNASLQHFGKFPLLLFWSAIQVTAISVMCSAYFRSTVGALIGTYICLTIVRVLESVIVLAVAIHLFALPIDGRLVLEGIIGDLLLVPPFGRTRTYGSSLLLGPIQAVVPPRIGGWAWTTDVALILARFLPPLIVAGLALWLASRLLSRRSVTIRQGTSIKEFVDRVGVWARRFNDNPLTRGRVVFKEGRRLPDDDPVAWRETTTRALGQPRYLIGNLLALEIPIILFLLTAGERVSGSDLHQIVANMQTFLWAGMSLMICVVVTGVIVQERQSQTLELLLTTPLTRREIARQKRAGIEPMLWILQAPLWTCLIYRAIIGSPLPYLYNEAGMLLIYPRIIAWLSVNSSVQKKTRLGAISDVFAGVGVWCIGGWLLGGGICSRLQIMMPDLIYSESRGPYYFWGHFTFAWMLLSPLTMLCMNLWPFEPHNYVHHSYVPGTINVVFSLAALLWIRKRCLNNAEKHLRM